MLKVDIEKLYQGEYWTNRYLIGSDDIEAVASQVAELINVEREMHSSLVTFTKARVSDTTPGTDVYYVLPINLVGLAAITSLLPLFNVVRVSLVPQTGRPGIKMYRGILSEANVENGIIDSGLITNLATFMSPWFDASPVGLVSPDNLPYLGVSISPIVGMRQLRRGTKRRTQPIL